MHTPRPHKNKFEVIKFHFGHRSPFKDTISAL